MERVSWHKDLRNAKQIQEAVFGEGKGCQISCLVCLFIEVSHILVKVNSPHSIIHAKFF